MGLRDRLSRGHGFRAHCIGLALLLGVLWPKLGTGQTATIEQEYAAAIKAFQAKNLDLAEREFVAIQHAAPDAPEPYFFLGKIYLYRNQLAKSQAMLERAIKLKPGFADALATLGVVYLRERVYSKAQSALLQATRLDPRNPFSRLDLGTAYMKQHRGPEAAQQFQTALRLAGANSSVASAANYNLSQLFDARSHELERRKAYSEAVKEFSRYTSAFPQNARARLALGIAYYNETNFNQALIEFEKAVQLDPQMPDAYYSAAETCAILRKWDEAQRYLAGALRINPRSFQANYLMGSVLVDSLRYDEAVRYLETAIALKPEDETAYLKLGQAYLSVKDPNKAFDPLNRAAAINPHDSQPHWLLGRAYTDLHETAKAREEFRAFRNLQHAHDRRN